MLVILPPPETRVVNVGATAVTVDEVTNVIAPPTAVKVLALVKVFVMVVAVTAGLFIRTV